jgi:hypothetical protein
MSRHHFVMMANVVDRAASAVFDRQFAHVFTSPFSTRYPRSNPMLPALWDGTDPLLGGHPAAPAASSEARV